VGVEALQAVAGTLYLLTITAVGFRLLQLARRTGKRPELLMALSLLIGGTLGATLEATGMGGAQTEIDPAVSGKLLLSGKLLGIVSLACQCLFIRMVFRPDSRWSLGLVIAIVAVPALAFAGFAQAGTFSSGQLPQSWFFFELVGRFGGSVWLMTEATRYYVMMKKRVQLGLADPVVTNRFLLWALAAGGGVMMMLTAVPPVIAPGSQHSLMVLDLLAFAFFGCVFSIIYGLAFFPPARYLAWLEAAPPGATSEGAL
jgi:hypothetical protein